MMFDVIWRVFLCFVLGVNGLHMFVLFFFVPFLGHVFDALNQR